MRKAVFITNIPAPYRVAMLNYAQEQLIEKGITLKVLFSARGYKRRHYWEGSLAKAKFPYRILNDFYIQPISDKFLSTGWSVNKVLREECPKVIILTGFSLPSINACYYAKKYNVPYILYCGETIFYAQQRWWKWLRNYQRRYILSGSTACIAYGTETKDYLISQGIDERKIFIAINSIDTEYFKHKLNQIININNEIIYDKMKILFVGNLIKRKGLENVIKALGIVQNNYGLQVSLDIVGGGPREKILKKLVKKLKLKDVIFYGAQNNDNILPFYKKSDLLIFPSLKEIFGLVMVEAAVAGLPIIASKFAGGTVDVVQDGKNGYVVDPTNIEELAARIRDLCEDHQKRKAMGQASLEIIENSVNIKRSAAGFVEAIAYAIQNSK